MTDLTMLIETTAIYSTGKPIQPSEIVPLMHLLIERLLRLPDSEVIVQECLDDLRYRSDCSKRHAGVLPICFKAGIKVRGYLQAEEIAVIDSDGVELRRYPVAQRQAALQYALEAACDHLGLDPEAHGFEVA